MVADTMTTSVVITCSSCSTSITATEESRQHAIRTRRPDESLATMERHAARRAANAAGWEYDHDADQFDVWLCSTCASSVAAQRTSPHPSWCSDCRGYEFRAQGTTHRRYWLTDEGEYLGEVNQQVDLDGTTLFTTVRINDVAEDFTSREELDRAVRLLASIAEFLDEHGLVLHEEPVESEGVRL